MNGIPTRQIAISRVCSWTVQTVLFISLVLAVWVASAAAITYQVKPGFNAIGVSKALRQQHPSAFPLLGAWYGAFGVTAVESYDYANARMLRAELNGATPTGDDFPLVENGALFVYAASVGGADLGEGGECPLLDFRAGFNLVSFSCLSAGYTAYDLIDSLGNTSVLSVSRFDNSAARWITAAPDAGTAAGDNFAITPGEGYVLYLASAVPNWVAPAQTFAFSPNTLSLQQEATGRLLTLTIPLPAPAGGITADLVSSDPAVLTVPAAVTIPAGAVSTTVALTPLATGSTGEATVEISAARTNWASATALVTVRPQLTVNLSPTTTITGQGWNYFLTLSLTEVAPAGGLDVTLTCAPAGIVACPATVTIPAGENGMQATITALEVGVATITASAPGVALSGTTNTVTVKPIQTIGIGPMLSLPVGVVVTPSPQSAPTMTYGPVRSLPVGVVAGPAITAVAPGSGSIGSTGLAVRVNGSGLASATGLSFLPDTGITIRPASFVAAADGSYCAVTIDIAGNAPLTSRTVILAGSAALPAGPGANQFRVTLPAPEIYGLSSTRGAVGSTFTLVVNGTNLSSATEIRFSGPGMAVGNPPSVNSNGTQATVAVSIAADAPLGARVVTIATPAGTTTDVASFANTFTVTSDAGTTYPSLVSQVVGVTVATAAVTSTQATYTPLRSLPVGVVVSPALTSLAPMSGVIGTSGLSVRINGAGLSSATGMAFMPETGITIRPGSFVAAADGSYCEAIIDIAGDAPLTARTVVLNGSTAMPATPGANQFRITLPEPGIHGIGPIRGMVGTTFTMAVNGTNLSSATEIRFSGPGISVNNPPAVNSAGTLATVTVAIAADAPLGTRVVTITTPGGTTTAAGSFANSFTVTSDAGVTYTPALSPLVGVRVATTPATTSDNAYGPLISRGVGIMVEQPPAPTTVNARYSPRLSLPVGVSVGASITGLTPKTIEPGTTAVITLHGTGLTGVSAVQIQPATGFTIGAPSAAADGLSATVSITADPSVVTGTRTLVVATPAGTIPAAAPAATLLRAGPLPLINSIVPIQQVIGNTFTLTIHGTNLQGATEVKFMPADGIQVSSMPTYYTDAQGEHVAVTVVIAGNATGGERVVAITTPYGNTGVEATAASTFTVIHP